MKSGETAHVSVHSLTLEGEGVAQLGERELRCRGAFPGERAEVRVESVSRQHPRAHARLLSLLEPHPARRSVPCPNHEAASGRCGGCALMALDEAAQREAKRQLLRDCFGLAVAPIEPAPRPLGYRYSSKRVVFAPRGVLRLGSFAHGSHAPAPMPGCLVDHARLAAAFDLVEREARALGLRAYDERSGHGDLRAVWGKTNGSEVILTFVTAAAQDESRVAELVPRLAGQVAGLLHSVQPVRGNALRGEPARLLYGCGELELELLGQRVELGALGFVQPNPEVAARAYRALTDLSDRAREGELAFDLYAGAGVTTRLLAAQFAEVVACEAHPESAQALGVRPEPVEQFLARELTRRPPRTPALVIANPPRKGLGDEVCRQLLALGAPALRIMSCGPAGLARDLAQLGAGYALETLEAFDTLPQTPHVELVAKLTRRRDG